jgi:light-regulated signal transduction histidine kinase (bacteriophytochrome)
VVLQNLLDNAVKYTRRQSVAAIEIGALRLEDGATAIFVRDNGVGFDMRYADRLFGVFQRLHRAEEFEGTGIGLATARRVVHRHGGRIWGEGEPDRGACFYFTIQPAGEGG